ncbi:hypothetical protein AWZ03_012698 [Drosophila navojoa]|uniref:Uncharacterized protein n=1 Tax=Drosophila navojoa TaxID=7232 RepID=A0A484AZ68_DRONA|nr:hypothetical protein AWZ03_012698 [Drosophila navojoa]
MWHVACGMRHAASIHGSPSAPAHPSLASSRASLACLGHPLALCNSLIINSGDCCTAATPTPTPTPTPTLWLPVGNANTRLCHQQRRWQRRQGARAGTDSPHATKSFVP